MSRSSPAKGNGSPPVTQKPFTPHCDASFPSPAQTPAGAQSELVGTATKRPHALNEPIGTQSVFPRLPGTEAKSFNGSQGAPPCAQAYAIASLPSATSGPVPPARKCTVACRSIKLTRVTPPGTAACAASRKPSENCATPSIAAVIPTVLTIAGGSMLRSNGKIDTPGLTLFVQASVIDWVAGGGSIATN